MKHYLYYFTKKIRLVMQPNSCWFEQKQRLYWIPYPIDAADPILDSLKAELSERLAVYAVAMKTIEEITKAPYIPNYLERRSELFGGAE